MKNKLWLLQIPVILLATCAFYIDETGVQGNLKNEYFREYLWQPLKRISALFTDRKFNFRGPRPPQNKIYIAAIDDDALAVFGRWPWHRDVQAQTVKRVLDYGAKVVGLDIVLAEKDQRVSDRLRELLKEKGLAAEAAAEETDPVFGAVLEIYRDKIVLGWAADQACQPLYEKACDVNHPDVISYNERFIPPTFPKFAISEFRTPTEFKSTETPFTSILSLIPNIPEFSMVGAHAGYFNTLPDPDSIIRRYTLFYMANSKPYPALNLEMARVGLGENLFVELNEEQRVKALGFTKSGKTISVSPQGVLDINFRGPRNTFPHFSIANLLSDSEVFEEDANGDFFKGKSKAEALKDAYVLVGPTAVGINDMRATPFDHNIEGVEIHANILDNILSGDPMLNSSMTGGTIWIYLFMIVGAAGWAYAVALLNAVPALLLFVGSFAAFALIDIKLLFANNYNWNTSFLYIEMFTIFVSTLAVKYVVEERKKKFIRGAFTKYVSPAVVDQILEDPTKLVVGGEKRELTILFSDIRGFTTFSEKMDAKQLSSLLNDYLGIMTNIVFKNEGTLDKYIGDAIMAFWGAPLNQPKHAANSARSAQQMMKALYENRQRYFDEYGIWVDVGVGLNTGVVSVGNMGSENNFAYTVIGDHVNLASRLEGLTKAYGASILTTRFTFDSIQASGEPFPDHRVLDFVKVKGKKKAVELIQVFERPMDPEGLKLFEEGRFLYTTQKFDEAMEKFGAANRLLASAPDKPDGPCNVFAERCQEFMSNPPAPDWDGSWEMHSK